MFIRLNRRQRAPTRASEGKPQPVIDFVLVESVRTAKGPRQRKVKHLATFCREDLVPPDVAELYHVICRRLIEFGQRITPAILAPVKGAMPVPDLPRWREEVEDARRFYERAPEVIRKQLEKMAGEERARREVSAKKKRLRMLRHARRDRMLFRFYQENLVKRAPIEVVAKHAELDCGELASAGSDAERRWLERKLRYEAAGKLGCRCDWMVRKELVFLAAQSRAAKTIRVIRAHRRRSAHE